MKIEFNSKEILLLLAASVMSLLVNLPDEMRGSVVDKRLLLSALIALVVVALFRYLQIYLLLLISILAIGANLPSEMASALGISQIAMIVSLAALIGVVLLNRAVGLFPVHSDSEEEEKTDARQDMLDAIARGDHATVHRLLVMNVSPNFFDNGTTPLHLAAEKGYPEIVQLLINYRADFRKKNAEGKTALEIALAKKKFVQTTEILHQVSKPHYSTSNQADTPHHAEIRRVDAELWQNNF